MKRSSGTALVAILLSATMLFLSRAEAGDSLDSFYANELSTAMDKIQTIRQDCETCGAWMQGQSDDPRIPQCRAPDQYRNLYKKDVVDMRVFVGYTDSGPIVSDTFMAAAFRSQIMQPCRSASGGACGFKGDPDDPEMFTKTIVGPDQRTKTVRLRVANSSVSYLSSKNRDANGNPTVQQSLKTDRLENLFREGLQQADLMIYSGHARNGGGPSLGPPDLIKGKDLPDLQKYYREKKSATRMYQALRETSTPPSILGIFACDADLHFGASLRKVAPSSGLVLGGSTETFESGLAHAFATLDSALALRCEDSFNQALNVNRQRDGYEISPVKVTNFFKASKRGTTPQQPGSLPANRPAAPPVDPQLAPTILEDAPTHPNYGGGYAPMTPAAPVPAPSRDIYRGTYVPPTYVPVPRYEPIRPTPASEDDGSLARSGGGAVQPGQYGGYYDRRQLTPVYQGSPVGAPYVPPTYYNTNGGN